MVHALTDWKMSHRGCIPKDTFPRIFKKCLDHLNDCNKAQKNIIAGFRGTGIHTLNPAKVLDHLPYSKSQPDTDNLQEAVTVASGTLDKSFETFLKDLYQKETQSIHAG
ncbi:hypothetical protein PR048_033070 [Dryococelus australis]|uniref:Uncharacterized protein n=1 Tax=Dryococelus australis TaxID=614101 RepID=A0ABQ9FZ86_9NEOP|nr:hypothetical protein PR048_033070 [Dryococelus australis]